MSEADGIDVSVNLSKGSGSLEERIGLALVKFYQLGKRFRRVLVNRGDLDDMIDRLDWRPTRSDFVTGFHLHTPVGSVVVDGMESIPPGQATFSRDQ